MKSENSYIREDESDKADAFIADLSVLLDSSNS